MIWEARVDGRSVKVELRQQDDGRFAVALDGQALAVDAREAGRGFVSLLVEGRSHTAAVARQADGWSVVIGRDAFVVELLEASRSGAAAPRAATGPARLKAPMPGKIVRVLAGVGALVEAGQGLVVMEAMKMENELRAPRPGTLRELGVHEGQTVETGHLIAVVE